MLCAAGVLWTAQFIFACQIMIIAGSVSAWYFTRDKSKYGCSKVRSPMCVALGRLVFFHLGSVALGSLLIALVQLARAVLMYIQEQCRGSQNEVVQYVLKCLSCCMWCLEKVLKFLTRNAYIMICESTHQQCALPATRCASQFFSYLPNTFNV